MSTSLLTLFSTQTIFGVSIGEVITGETLKGKTPGLITPIYFYLFYNRKHLCQVLTTQKCILIINKLEIGGLRNWSKC